MDSIITLKNAGFAYDDKRVLSNLTLAIKPGEFLGIIGPNGAGKTTLLRLLCNLLSPSQGQVLLDGVPLDSMDSLQVARTVGLVPQEHNMVYPFRASEVVLMGRHPYLGGALALEQEDDILAARDAMERTDCLYLADKYFNELSGGEKQRVIIASALAQEPKVLLLDEPTANLDLKHQVLLYQLLRELRQTSGLTVVSVTHDLNLASLFADRLLLLKAGRSVMLDTPAKVLKQATLEAVYETKLAIIKNGSGKPFVLPKPSTVTAKRTPKSKK
jgi:iron complex transport system ATP-binding protein